MSYDKAKQHLEKYNLQDRIILFDASTATVALAALALGTTEGEIAKSLGFLVKNQENSILDLEPILIIVAGDKKIDNAKYKTFFSQKAKMISFDIVEELVGHAAGGVCPFGVNDNVKVYLDDSLKKYEYVYPACGNAHSAVKLKIEELEIASNFISWVDVCK